jgi:hypothetical protein
MQDNPSFLLISHHLQAATVFALRRDGVYICVAPLRCKIATLNALTCLLEVDASCYNVVGHANLVLSPLCWR